jgi:hypothetical protein
LLSLFVVGRMQESEEVNKTSQAPGAACLNSFRLRQ